jgi:RimJ/RimL family protein N-acetyltransferase
MWSPILQGARVRLRPYRAGDRDALLALFGDPRVVRYWSFAPWTSLADADAYLAPLLAPPASDDDEPTSVPWALADLATDALLGTATIFALQREQQRAEVGYSLASAHQGRGLAREAVTLALGHAFDVLGLRRVEADVDPRNLPSCKLLERLGFKREGLLRERWNVNGEICDTALYGLLARELIRVRAEALRDGG